MIDDTDMPNQLICDSCKSKYNLKATHIATIHTRMNKFTCSAVNMNSNLIIIYWQKQSNRSLRTQYGQSRLWEYILSIFTSDGYFVTGTHLADGEYIAEVRTARFTDDVIMIYGKEYGLTIFSDFLTKPFHSRERTFFIESDEKGNIYTNGDETNEIVVYAPNLEFRRRFNLNLPDCATIESLVIRNNYIVIAAKHDSSFHSRFLIYRFDLSTLKPLGYSEIHEKYKLVSPDICIDRCNNILVETRNGICIWMYRGSVRSIKFESGDDETHGCFMITNDSRIIRVTRSDTIEIHQLLFPI